jgi:hypothetical protein
MRLRIMYEALTGDGRIVMIRDALVWTNLQKVQCLDFSKEASWVLEFDRRDIEMRGSDVHITVHMTTPRSNRNSIGVLLSSEGAREDEIGAGTIKKLNTLQDMVLWLKGTTAAIPDEYGTYINMVETDGLIIVKDGGDRITLSRSFSRDDNILDEVNVCVNSEVLCL